MVEVLIVVMEWWLVVISTC